MGTKNPPDGITAVTGTWPTDFDREESTVLIGQYALKFVAGTGAKELAHTYLTPADASRRYQMNLISRGSSAVAGTTFEVVVDYYDKIKVIISSTTLVSETHTAANTWEYRSAVFTTPSNCAYVKLRFKKLATATSWSWIIQLGGIFKLAPGKLLTRNAALTITKATWTTVTFNTTQLSEAENANVAKAGWHIVTAAVTIGGLNAGSLVQLRIRQIDATNWIKGEPTYNRGGGAADTTATIAALVYRTRENLALDIQVVHDDSVDRDIVADAEETWYGAVHIAAG